ncbi:tripartite tricarboxylate transporter TctB family protein [Paraburkholderia susongensis]|uniref:Tripartite tricarboxylate transporter TctB family protein n=1 Tax=Paraburkholderia susongensis TaxID=1515439 RepID=A0A1X7LH86_9BURK|nr:tripartite tricarboxylate transporter TctB family protein [Paraburkholderia susongensis]SMG53226.1 Tripartite tricarboxylate transporter TctB family protein [Paraburkholderia susongensis]
MNGQGIADAGRRGFLSGYRRDYYGGALMCLIGASAVVRGLHYNFGSLTHMGPGFFPTCLGAILILLGLSIAGTAKRPSLRKLRHEGAPLASAGPEWRGWLCIIASIVAFVVLGKWGGLLPASFAITFISAFGDRDNTWKSALTLAVVITLVAVVIFWWALQLQFPLLAWGNS